MKLQSRKKVGHDRCVAPRETIERLEALLRPHHDYWLHEETVSADLHWAAMFIDGLEFRSMGKGITREGSIAGALAEGAEWLTACATGNLPGYVGAREEDLPDALPLSDLLGHVANATPAVLERIRALDEAYHWVDGYSLLSGKLMKVPLEYVRVICGPNGRASGNNLEEAVLHGLLEVFERRAHLAVLRNRMVVPTIDPASVPDPVIHRQLEFMHRHGIEVVLKDLSFEGVLPCVGAYFVDHNIPEDYQFRHFFKVGSSFNTREALLRLFTEYAQGRRGHEFLQPQASDRDTRLAELLNHDFRRLPAQSADCDNFLASFMFGCVPYRDAGFLREGVPVPCVLDQGGTDCLDDIERAATICEVLGKDCIVVDLTDPAFGFPVAQVVVPGYSDVLPYHPADSPGLFRQWTRTDVLKSYRIQESGDKEG